MDLYDLLLFLHISAAVVWIGSGGLIQILAMRAERAGDREGLKRIADDAAALGETLFIPASFATLLLGVGLTIDGPWAFDQLWIVLGLAGFLATALTGVLVMKPTTERISAMTERSGFTDEAFLETRKLLVKGRVDLVTLYLVIAVMTIKPTSDDVGLLAAMAVILAGGLAYVVLRLRAIDAETAAPVAPLAP